jgi:hypothetical protein
MNGTACHTTSIQMLANARYRILLELRFVRSPKTRSRVSSQLITP